MTRKALGNGRNVVGRTGGRSRRRAVLLSLVIAMGAGMVMRTVLAVHDTGRFELDGNAVLNGAAPLNDWANVFNNTHTAAAATFNADGSLNATIFTGGGSKDPQDINQWAWKDGAGGLPDKDNLLHSFAARYSLPPTPPGGSCPNGTGSDPVTDPFDPTVPCDVLFFGSDRYDNSGDAQQGFWFFQNAVSTRWDSNGDGSLDADCPQSIGGGTGFCDPETGLPAEHEAGDLLLISNFSNGGTTSTISVYVWDPTINGNLRLLATSTAANCNTAVPGDAFCGIVNPGPGLTTSPWPFLDKSGNTNFANGEFYEGGVNLSTLGLAGECFASVASESRSSTSTTATLKDFVLGGFASCETGLTTTPKDGVGGAIPTGGLSIGTGSIQVTDSAVLTISGISSWTGTLKFFLCGPADLVSQTTCVAGGTQIGTDMTVTNATAQPILSAAATITSAGNYCWRGEFISGTSGVPGDTDSSAGECFTVNPVQPIIPTEASAAVTLGNPVSDVANLSGTASKPGTPVINPTTAGLAAAGSITFSLYGPDDATCSGTAVFTSTVNVNGNGIYNSGNFTPTAAGTYRWTATYTGDLPNTLAATGVCNAANESVVVNPVQPAIVTQATVGPVNLGASLDDVATLSGTASQPDGDPAGGTITFRLYGPSSTPDCTTTPIATSVVNVSGNGNYTASTGTITGSLTPTQAGTYHWVASYSGDLPNTLAVSGACGDANESTVVQQLNPTISTAQTFWVRDSATIRVATGGAGNLAGNVRFQLFNNPGCLMDSNGNQRLHDQTVAVAGTGSFPQSVTVNSAMVQLPSTSPLTLSWLVTYTSTNAGHTNVTSSCGTENASLTVNNGPQQ